MFITALTIFHILICIFLIVIVLVQHGKGADIGATFGGASNTVFGARGAATVLSKITIAAAVLFMVTSMSLAVLATKQTGGSIFNEGTPSEESAPAMGAAEEPGEENAAETKAQEAEPTAEDTEAATQENDAPVNPEGDAGTEAGTGSPSAEPKE